MPTAAWPLSVADLLPLGLFRPDFCAKSAQSQVHPCWRRFAGTPPPLPAHGTRAQLGLTHDSDTRRLSGRARGGDEPGVIHSPSRTGGFPQSGRLTLARERHFLWVLVSGVQGQSPGCRLRSGLVRTRLAVAGLAKSTHRVTTRAPSLPA